MVVVAGILQGFTSAYFCVSLLFPKQCGGVLRACLVEIFQVHFSTARTNSMAGAGAFLDCALVVCVCAVIVCSFTPMFLSVCSHTCVPSCVLLDVQCVQSHMCTFMLVLSYEVCVHAFAFICFRCCSHLCVLAHLCSHVCVFKYVFQRVCSLTFVLSPHAIKMLYVL